VGVQLEEFIWELHFNTAVAYYSLSRNEEARWLRRKSVTTNNSVNAHCCRDCDRRSTSIEPKVLNVVTLRQWRSNTRFGDWSS